MTVYVPEILRTDKDGFCHLGRLWNDVKDAEGRVTFNFDQCKQIDANLAAALGAMLDRLLFSGRDPYITYPKSIGAKRALARIGFFKAFNMPTDTEEREQYIRYRRFSVDQETDFKEYIHEDLIQKRRFPHCTVEAERKIIESIYEIFANAVTHSGCQMVYCCGESHTRMGRPMLDMAIVNMGRTIPDNVNEYLVNTFESPRSPCECVEWAFQKGNTTKMMPGGLGLDILKEFITANEGKIQMVSGFAMMDFSAGDFTFHKLNYHFPGTIVNVVFNCADNKSYSWADEVTDLQDLF